MNAYDAYGRSWRLLREVFSGTLGVRLQIYDDEQVLASVDLDRDGLAELQRAINERLEEIEKGG